ncbi:MAG TPA: cation:proton antiporter, partial [Methanomassiliicoccales archaeon]|nr:cation:proton antiporter [Methanomassiliicoccales archaeon]
MDNTTQMLLGMAMIMIIAGISSVVFTKLRFPAVIGYLAAGMVLGPRGLGSVFQIDMNIVNFLADLGIVLLMFSIGLEFNFTKLRRIGGFAMLAGTIEVLITLTIGYSLGIALGYPFVESVFLGAIMSISSTAVILSVLGGMGKLKDDFVQPMIGILIVEDIAAVVLLTLTSPLLSGQVPQLSDAIDILIVIALFVAFSLVLGVALIPRLVDRVARGYSSETLMLVALGLGFSMALVAAAIGLSVAIGAFVMGVILGHADSCCRIEEKVRPIKEMFLAVFFVSIGLLIQPNLVILNIIPAIIIALVFIAAKTFSVTFAGYIANLPARTSFLLGASVVAMGEFSFVIAKQGVAAGAVTDAFYSAVVGAALITMVLLPISAKNGGRAFDGLAKRAPKRFVSTMG